MMPLLGGAALGGLPIGVSRGGAQGARAPPLAG